MDGNSLVLILTLILLVLCSAFFSSAETAYSSMNRMRIKAMANDGNKRAEKALQLVENYDQLISTILIGNNIVNIVSASLSTVLFTAWIGGRGVTLSTVVMTVLILLFGEITPKSYAKEHAESIAMAYAAPMRALEILIKPIGFLFMQWQKLVARLTQSTDDGGITEQELLTIVEEAQSEGGLDEHESDLIRSAIEFNDGNADDILTPRVDMVAIDVEDANAVIEQQFKESGFSRLPVYADNIDNIIGILHEKDFFFHRAHKRVRELMTPPLFIMPTTKLSALLRSLQKQKSHMAIVMDEFGGTAGLVTMEDILEELVGEIWDEHDEVVEDFAPLSDGSYRITGNANLEKMEELLNFTSDSESTTVSGWVIEQLGQIPAEGDAFDYQTIHVQVTKVDSRRVLEVLARRTEDPESNA